MARFSSRRASDPDKAILWASKAISDVADRLSLEETIKDRACLIYKTLEDEKCTRGRNKEALVSACVYLACREEGGPRTVKEISSTVARATEKDIGRAIEFIVKQLKAKPGESMVMDTILPGEYLRRLCFNLGMSNEEMKVVQESVRKARDFDIRKSPMSVAGAIIFMVTQLSGSKKSLQDISVATAVAEGTIKNSYTELLPHASEFMPQWYAKEQDLTNLNLDHSNPEV